METQEIESCPNTKSPFDKFEEVFVACVVLIFLLGCFSIRVYSRLNSEVTVFSQMKTNTRNSDSDTDQVYTSSTTDVRTGDPKKTLPPRQVLFFCVFDACEHKSLSFCVPRSFADEKQIFEKDLLPQVCDNRSLLIVRDCS